MDQRPRIGFIGQGFIGKSYADDFENRGYAVVRYALEAPYVDNKSRIAECDFVLIAVPTPTTPRGFDVSILENVLPLVGTGKTAVIKSTVLPGTTESLQRNYPDITILFSPEFLIAATAAEDAAHPIMNIVGWVHEKDATQAKTFLNLLPESPYQKIMTATEAELIKYVHNIHGYCRILFTNLMYDVAETVGADWNVVQEAMDADPYLSIKAGYYNNPVHKSGRGAGGLCFVKDFAAFRKFMEDADQDPESLEVMRALEQKNLALLRESNKDQSIVAEVYGDRQE